MSKKTLKQAYQHIRKHLLTQGRRSVNGPEGVCMYRSPEGMSCAVGCLIDDEHYDPVLELMNAKNPAVLEVLEKSGWPIHGEAFQLYMRLQSIHDNEPPSLWEEWLDKVESSLFPNGRGL